MRRYLRDLHIDEGIVANISAVTLDLAIWIGGGIPFTQSHSRQSPIAGNGSHAMRRSQDITIVDQRTTAMVSNLIARYDDERNKKETQIYKPSYWTPISAGLTLCVSDQRHPGKLLLSRYHAAHNAIAEVVATVGNSWQQIGAFPGGRRRGLRLRLRLWCGLTPNRLLCDCTAVGAANLQENKNHLLIARDIIN